MNGSKKNVAVRILKFDGCNTNIVSTCFFWKMKKLINMERNKLRIEYSRQGKQPSLSKIKIL